MSQFKRRMAGYVYRPFAAIQFCVWIAAMGVFFIGLVLTIVVGLWDTSVWLFNADWRTSNFEIPVLSGGATVVAYFIAVVMGNFGEVLDKFAERHGLWE